MLIEGRWQLCDDGLERPVLRGEVQKAGGGWEPAEFLVDTGADRTVLSANILGALGLVAPVGGGRIGGVGGVIDIVEIDTQVRLTREDRGKVTFRSRYAACRLPDVLDMSVLGQDVLGLFALVVDRAHDRVCLLSGKHQYRIETR